MTGHRSKEHYVPLDSVRGIAALSVVVHHFVISEPLGAILPHKAWIDFAFFHNAWLFVDLFFVLSGIVISMSYVQGGFGTFEFREYIVRRLARIYPLHIVTLLAFLSFRMMKLGLVGIGLLHFVPSEMAVNNGYSFFLNVLLLQALGFIDYLSWNGPSWSISAEFYTYLVFGGVVVLAQKLRDVRIIFMMSLALLLASAAFILLVLRHYSLDFHTYGFARCILSFFLGVLTLKAVALVPVAVRPSVQAMWQIGAAMAAIAIVCVVGMQPMLSYLAPVIFAVLLGSLMAFPGRSLPSLLSVKPLVWLGKRSYSIYMVHALVLVLIEYFSRGAGLRTFQMVDQFGPGLAASLLLSGYVVAVLALSNLTYANIEMPGSKAIVGLLARRPRVVAAAEGGGQ
ncbi:acyltransferase [Bradyrhizobium sp. LjRoot220]|uniref:acyltransferase family protein n=1 Tax=Bradyrhizobium sp. LjRoot220 TaxID=3342284 RepID=UPI003ECF6D3B